MRINHEESIGSKDYGISNGDESKDNDLIAEDLKKQFNELLEKHYLLELDNPYYQKPKSVEQTLDISMDELKIRLKKLTSRVLDLANENNRLTKDNNLLRRDIDNYKSKTGIDLTK